MTAASPVPAFGHTDAGRRRASNQDSYLCVPLATGNRRGALLAVADGMGGHAGGDVASEVAIEALRESLTRSLGTEGSAVDVSAALTAALQSANQRILERADAHGELRGMGSTMVAAVVLDASAWIANVGDSRAYLIDGDGIRRITVDHVWENDESARGSLSAEEVAASPFKGMITRSLGTRSELEVDVFPLTLSPGDSLLLCSDGVYRELDEETIGAVVAKERDPERSCRRLLALANEAGASDNITCVVAGPVASASRSSGSSRDTQPLDSTSPRRGSAAEPR